MKNKTSTLREYELRINRVIDYIGTNWGQELSLNEISRMAPFSPYHFHRIFHGFVGETLHSYVKRIRLEKAVNKLLHNDYISLTELALEFGFASLSHFSKEFKDCFGVSPSEYRGDIPLHLGRKEKEDFGNFPIKIKSLPEYHVAYVRKIGRYEKTMAQAFEPLLKWAGPRNFINRKSLFMSIAYDNPYVTEPEKCRLDACITIDENVETSGEISQGRLRGGKYAVLHFRGIGDKITTAYHTLYGKWLRQSGYEPDDYPILTFHLHRFSNFSLTQDELTLDICLPIKPL